MNKMIIAILMGWLSIGITGCDQNSGGNGGTAVGTVKLQELMRELGDLSQIELTLEKMRKQRTVELEQIRKMLEDEYNKKKEEFGEKPTDIQKRELAVLLQKSETTFRKNQLKMNTEFTNLRNKLMSERRKEYNSGVQKVAEQQGLSLVLFTDIGGVGYAAKGIDITKQVLESIKADRKANGSPSLLPNITTTPNPTNPTPPSTK